MALVHESQIGLMHQSGCLKSVVAPFLPQIVRRQLAEFVVHNRDESCQGLLVAARALLQQQSYVDRRRVHGEPRMSETQETGDTIHEKPNCAAASAAPFSGFPIIWKRAKRVKTRSPNPKNPKNDAFQG